MKFRLFARKFTAGSLVVAMMGLVPGLPFYEAIASQTNHGSGHPIAPGPIPGAKLPASNLGGAPKISHDGSAPSNGPAVELPTLPPPALTQPTAGPVTAKPTAGQVQTGHSGGKASARFSNGLGAGGAVNFDGVGQRDSSEVLPPSADAEVVATGVGRSVASAAPALKPHSPVRALSDAAAARLLKGYFRGQVALLAEFALHKSLFTPVAAALAGPMGLSWGRSAYQLALAILAPVSGVLTERFPIRSILIGTMAARAIIWGAALPTAYAALGVGGPLTSVFVSLMFLDGAIVCVNALVDIDAAGLDIMSKQHGFKIDAVVRNHYNTLLEGYYSAARMILAPAVAAAGLYAVGLLSATGALIAMMALSFTIPSVIGIYYYARYIPKESQIVAPKLSEIGPELRAIPGKIWDAAKLAWAKTRLRNRIGLYGIDMAIIDGFSWFFQAYFALEVLAKGDRPLGALYASILIAVANLGNVVTSWIMHKHWHAPKDGEAKYPRYKIFFKLALIGALSSVLIPAAMVGTDGRFWPAFLLAAAAGFIFNVFFTAVDLGFRNLTQGIVSEEGASGRLFGIQGFYKNFFGAIAVSALGLLFTYSPSLASAYAIAAGIFIFVAFFELVFGPRLLFTEEERGRK